MYITNDRSHVTHYCTASNMDHTQGMFDSCLSAVTAMSHMIAERLSARHVIAEYCVEIVCLYICIYVTLRNAISPYGEAHTVVLYARATRASIARPRDCTFFHNY